MSRSPAKEVDEQLLIAHNIACAASIIACNRGVNPKEAHICPEMDKIISEVTTAYKYTIWREFKYDLNTILDILNVRQQSLWNSGSSDPG